MTGTAHADIHQQLALAELREALDHHSVASWGPFDCSEEGVLAVMDEFSFASGLLSVPVPVTHLGDDPEAHDLIRRTGERIAGLMRHPDRLGMFASVSLPNVDGSPEAVGYAYDQCPPDGFVLLANTQGIYLADPKWEPVVAEIDRSTGLDEAAQAAIDYSTAEVLLSRLALNGHDIKWALS